MYKIDSDIVLCAEPTPKYKFIEYSGVVAGASQDSGLGEGQAGEETRCMDYRRLDYFGLHGRLDYKDIWTTAVWTTKTNRLKVFRPLGLTEISD